jgi:hypothetical protein
MRSGTASTVRSSQIRPTTRSVCRLWARRWSHSEGLLDPQALTVNRLPHPNRPWPRPVPRLGAGGRIRAPVPAEARRIMAHAISFPRRCSRFAQNWPKPKLSGERPCARHCSSAVDPAKAPSFFASTSRYCSRSKIFCCPLKHRSCRATHDICSSWAGLRSRLLRLCICEPEGIPHRREARCRTGTERR